ncbi:MAG: hypothetical protein COB81_08290 [Flavobacteriaceae bacterium]|nr:MAG: hypothetical protein COB81_08290 [Flavobacteriaceae bacterium]
MAVISVYLEIIVLVIPYIIYMVNLSFQNLGPNVSQIVLLVVIVSSFCVKLGEITIVKYDKKSNFLF